MEVKNILTVTDFVRNYTGEKIADALIRECMHNGLVSDISDINYNKYSDFTQRKC